MEQKKKQIQVRYSNWGLANFFGDYIEINKKLKYNKPLRDYIIKHELGHSLKFDLNYEIKDSFFLLTKPHIAFSLFVLCITTPSTWIDFLPIQIRKGQIIYDVNMIILFCISTFLILFLIKLH